MGKRWFFLGICLLIIFSSCFSQSKPDAATWKNIETSIHQQKNLETTFGRLQFIKQQAEANHQSIELARSLCYSMLIKDLKTEDSLYFRNSSFIDSILQNSSNTKLNLLMHYLQAQRLWKFRTKYLRFNRARYETKDLPYNYAAFSNDQLDSLINYHFEKAKALNDMLEKTQEKPWNIDQILWLSSSPLSFLFRPTLTDIIFLEQINALKSTESYSPLFSSFSKDWLSFSQNHFIDSLKVLGRNERLPASIRLYLQWLDRHSGDTAVYYCIETLLREYVYNSLSPYYNLDIQKEYETYLQKIAASEFAGVKARAIFQLCFLWKDWSLKYAPGNFRYESYQQSFDTSFQYYAAKALQLYEGNKELFENYAYLQRQLEQLKTAILSPELQVLFNYESEKNKPILLKVEYKNVPVFHCRIVRLNFNENLAGIKADKQFIISHQTVKEQETNLTLPADYNIHRSFVKLPELSAGRYCLLFSDQSLDSETHYSYQTFVVSNMAILHADERVYVVNRTTGLPIKGAIITASYDKKEGNQMVRTIHSSYTSNEEGSVVFPKEKTYTLLVTYKGDTLKDAVSTKMREMTDEVFNKEDYDDLVDFYDENTKVMIFTDRGIYRPGQKLFYKAIFITRNPRTGETMIMNGPHLKKGFQNYLKKWVREEEPLLYLSDPFGREIDSIKVKPDEYGAMSGSFTIPKNAATGEWSIEPDYLDLYDVNNGTFKVEEYKRPTFELKVDKPSKAYRITDTLSFTVRLKSFAGGALNHTPVKYEIERQTSSGFTSAFNDFSIDSSNYTDDEGVLVIKFVDPAMRAVDRADDITLTYDLVATATDVTGETHDVTATLKVSTRPVRIAIPFFATADINNLRPLLITAKDVNDVALSTILEVKLYRIYNSSASPENDVSSYADQWAYPATQWQQWFPDLNFSSDSAKEKEELLFESTINTADFQKFKWPVDKLLAGKYKIVVSATDDGFVAGESTRSFTLFDSRFKDLPSGEDAFFYLPANYFQPGDTVHLFSGSSYDTTYAILQLKYYSQKKGKQIVTQFFSIRKTKGIQEWKWKIPLDVSGPVTISEVYVVHNELYRHEEAIEVNTDKEQPQIIVEQFRSQLYPGASTTYSVSIKTKDKNVAAELMTTIYDASLDKLEKHQWELPRLESSPRLYSNWPRYISSSVQGQLQFVINKDYTSTLKPVWWMDSITVPGSSSSFNLRQSEMMLEGKVSGLDITNGAGLQEVVVVGYGSVRRELTASTASIQIRGISSLRQYQQPLIILDGVPFTGDLSSIDLKEVTQAMALKDADAVALYGSKAAQGVLIISTKGEIKLPVPKQEPVLKIRSNFNETAFFAPAIHADKNGYYSFTFTMPESVTEWNWKLFAHTKSAEFMYAERKLVTQLPLMVQPHLPLGLYQGDRIILKSRISNLDSLAKNGVAFCKVEDAVTGEQLTENLLRESERDFAIGKRSTVSVSFELQVPEHQLHPLKISISAKTGEFADGEEHSIPVLSKKILVKENESITLFNKDTLVAIPRALNDSDLYGMELSIDPKPQTALLNSLPYLAHYSFDCAEQLFNKLNAYAVAVHIVRRDTSIQNLLRKNRMNTEKSPGERSPDSLIEQTMPWLALAEKERKEQSQLADLLDTMKSNSKIENYLGKLFRLQNTDGGLSWFEGGNSNSYISLYVLSGFGKLAAMGWSPNVKDGYLSNRYQKFIQKLKGYADHDFLGSNPTAIHNAIWFAYARSFWTKAFPVSDSVRAKIRTTLVKAWNSEDHSLESGALLVITTIRYFSDDPVLYSKAMQQLQSIRQLAIVDENGIRWKDIADADDLETSAEETLALLVEAFESGGEEKKIIPGVIKWLMSFKNEQQWTTTKGTAAAIELLLREQDTIIGNRNSVTAVVNDASFSISDDLLSGRTSGFQKIADTQMIRLKKNGNEVANANIGWYYFSDPADLNGLNKEVIISKRWYHLNQQTKSWELSDSATVYKVGEKVRIVLVIETSKALRYVRIDDKRSAALEPEEYNSGYQFGKWVSYYESVHDAGIDFFAEFIPSGKTEISYEMVVTQEGRFSGGTAMLQCMYKPSVTSYSITGFISTKQ